jgi:hypothetical protein
MGGPFEGRQSSFAESDPFSSLFQSGGAERCAETATNDSCIVGEVPISTRDPFEAPGCNFPPTHQQQTTPPTLVVCEHPSALGYACVHVEPQNVTVVLTELSQSVFPSPHSLPPSSVPPALIVILARTQTKTSSLARSLAFSLSLALYFMLVSPKINARYHENQRILGDSSSPKDNNGDQEPIVMSATRKHWLQVINGESSIALQCVAARGRVQASGAVEDSGKGFSASGSQIVSY